MVLYLTYNDQPSGVYWSQVTDVVEHLNSLGGPKVKLIALVSGRDFLSTRKKIKAHSPSAWVLPMVPTMKRWKLNTVILAWVCRLLKPSGLICRGPFATWMALRMRERGLTKKVCFDGRGAYAAEWEEYRIIDDDALIAQFRPLENEAVNASDFRIAVSQALVEHWRERYGYAGEAHVVVPCTLGVSHLLGAEALDTDAVRAGLGFSTTDVVLVYSGSTAGWQSFSLVESILTKVLSIQPEVNVLFLTRADRNNEKLSRAFPGRVQVKWMEAEQVGAVLRACDHGLLVREPTITNRVASPTKFAEYLSAGLPVLISDRLGDFSEMVQQNGLGLVWYGDDEGALFGRPSVEERRRLMDFALKHFTKAAHDASYRAVMKTLC